GDEQVAAADAGQVLQVRGGVEAGRPPEAAGEVNIPGGILGDCVDLIIDGPRAADAEPRGEPDGQAPARPPLPAPRPPGEGPRPSQAPVLRPGNDARTTGASGVPAHGTHSPKGDGDRAWVDQRRRRRGGFPQVVGVTPGLIGPRSPLPEN